MTIHRYLSIAAQALFLLVVLVSSANAQAIFNVNTTTDGADTNPGNGTCRSAPGICSLRAAIEEANATPNGATPDVIVFNGIPIVGGLAIIAVTSTPLPAITEPTIVDATGAAGEVVLDGSSLVGVGLTYSGLVLSAGSDGSTIRRLTVGNFPGNGIYVTSDDNILVKNSIGVRGDGTDIGNDWSGIYVRGDGNFVGRAALGNMIGFNELSGIVVFEGNNNYIFGNFVGTDAVGSDFGNGPDLVSNAYAGISVNGEGNIVGGTLAEQGNTIGFNVPVGVRLYGSNNTVRSNYIGTDAAGRDLGNLKEGLLIDEGDHTIGGAETGMGNTIGFNTTGIRIESGDNKIQGNFIGTNSAGADIGNDRVGIEIYYVGAVNNVIGHSEHATIPLGSGKSNTIAHNGIGVIVGDLQTQENTIRGNIIRANDELGIDLDNDGVTTNDTLDGDYGPNGLMNFPDVTRAFYRPGSDAIVVEFSVSSDEALVPYPLTVDAYLADDAVSGEGETFIGSYSYTTSGAVVQWEIPAAGITWDPLDYVVLTTTDTLGNTSEFSAPQGPLDPLAIAVAARDGVDGVDAGDQMDRINHAPLDILGAPYPNPFNPHTAFTFSLAEASHVHAAVYDIVGRQVALLHDGELTASTHTFSFDGSGMATGVYLLRVQTSRFVETRRLMLVK
jgi:CSLREA domain-containing protein